MATKRKVNNLLALAVLSTVTYRPMHPYEMATAIRSWGKEQDMGIKWGSLYTVVRNLSKHGFLEAIENSRQGGRPERTVYRITEAGRAEVRDWTRELLSTPDRGVSSFTAGLSLLAGVPPDDVIALLRTRLEAVTEDVERRRTVLTESALEIPRLFLVEDEYELAIRSAEENWIRSLLDELTSGRYPDLATWRKAHKEGHPPAEWLALAERSLPN